jgi:S-adenosylmethionine uptake transporter
MSLPRSTRAYGFALLSFGFFSSHDAIIKALGEGISVVQIIFFGSLFSLVPLSIVAMLDKGRSGLMPLHPWLLSLRTVLILISLTSAFYAFTVLPLSEVYALLFITPLLITAWSVPLLGEHVGLPRWAAVVVGLAGVLVVLRPGIVALELGHIAALVSALGASLAMIIMRKIGNHERSVVLMLFPASAAIVVMGAMLPTVFVPMSLGQVGALAVVGVLFIGAQLCVITAYRLAPSVALIAPVQYTQILWATLYGALFFDEFPDIWVAVGAMIIIGSGLFVVWREARAK